MRTARFDRISVREVTLNFHDATPLVEAKAAYQDNKGRTYGYTTGRTWSPMTQNLLLQLKASMEADMESLQFMEDAPVVRTAASAVSQVLADEEGGLGEHFSTRQVPG
jgi:hypothetical protein